MPSQQEKDPYEPDRKVTLALMSKTNNVGSTSGIEIRDTVDCYLARRIRERPCFDVWSTPYIGRHISCSFQKQKSVIRRYHNVTNNTHKNMFRLTPPLDITQSLGTDLLAYTYVVYSSDVPVTH